MASKQTTEQVIGLIKSGMRSTDIATNLRISLPTVQGIKSHLTLKSRTSPRINNDKTDLSVDDSTLQRKSEAIISGYFLDKSISSPTADELNASIQDFSRLVAQLTSTNKLSRVSAKKTIEHFVRLHEEASSNEEQTIDAASEHPETNRGKRWTRAEQDALIKVWNDHNSKRDAKTVRQISEKHNRTELAIIVRLFQASQITMAQGDQLCIVLQTPILISEKFTHPVTSSTNGSSLRHENSSQSLADKASNQSHQNAEETRLCVECFQSIPKARLHVSPFTSHCTKCLSRLEKRIDYHQYIDEGLAGTRQEHKKMRSQDLVDLNERSRI